MNYAVQVKKLQWRHCFRFNQPTQSFFALLLQIVKDIKFQFNKKFNEISFLFEVSEVLEDVECFKSNFLSWEKWVCEAHCLNFEGWNQLYCEFSISNLWDFDEKLMKKQRNKSSVNIVKRNNSWKLRFYWMNFMERKYFFLFVLCQYLFRSYLQPLDMIIWCLRPPVWGQSSLCSVVVPIYLIP